MNKMKSEEKTTITVSKSVKERLGYYGTAHDSYNDVVVRLMNCYDRYCIKAQEVERIVGDASEKATREQMEKLDKQDKE